VLAYQSERSSAAPQSADSARVQPRGTAPPPPGGPGGPSGGARPGGPGGPGMQSGPPPPSSIAVAPDSFVAERDSLMNEVLKRIAGKENVAAESVFKNIKVFKGRPAGQLPRAMNAFGRSLGVSCKHCHVEGHWADDDKKPKLATRDMLEMVQTINTDLLGKMKNLRSEHPSVGCFTCHRGQARPAVRLAMPEGTH
jgi:hypothetical protein